MSLAMGEDYLDLVKLFGITVVEVKYGIVLCMAADGHAT